MSQLSQDLITEILSRLPIKPLVQFKCVCKTWHSIINNPEFAKLQLRRANANNYRVLLMTWPPQSLDYEASYNSDAGTAVQNLLYPEIVKCPPEDFYVSFLGSCDGLVCLLLDYRIMFLWNPTTGDYKELPNPDDAFHSCFLSGIGYNVKNDDYGILFSTRFNSNQAEETTVELYTLKTGTWRRIEDTDLAPKSFTGSVTWNGDIYWLAIKESGVNGEYMLVSFDMTEMKFKEILRLPDNFVPNNLSSASLGTSGENLCVFCEAEESFFEALILNFKGKEASWRKLFSFPHDIFEGYGNTALCLTKNGEVVMDSDGWQIYLYNPKERRTKYFKVDHYEDSVSGLYVESLISPNNYG